MIADKDAEIAALKAENIQLRIELGDAKRKVERLVDMLCALWGDDPAMNEFFQEFKDDTKADQSMAGELARLSSNLLNTITELREDITARNIADMRRKIAEKEQHVAELRREVDERRMADWRHRVLAWAESEDRNLAEVPQVPAGLFPWADLTDEEWQEWQARKDLIAQAMKMSQEYEKGES